MRVNIHSNGKQLSHNVLFVTQQMQSVHLQEQQVRPPKSGKHSRRQLVGQARFCASGVTAGGAEVASERKVPADIVGRAFLCGLPVLRVGSLPGVWGTAGSGVDPAFGASHLGDLGAVLVDLQP